MGTAARVAVATGSSTGVSSYSMIVFTGWDYSCLGDRATKLKQKNILYQLQVRRDLSYLTGWSAGKEKCDPHVAALLHSFVCTMWPLISLLSLGQVDLEEESRKRHEADLSTSKKVILYSLRVLMTVLSLGFIGGAFYGIYVTTQFSQVNDVKIMMPTWSSWSSGWPSPISAKQNRADEQGILGFIIQYLPSMVITAGNFVVPLLCDKIALVEQYSPSTTIILALLRFVRKGLCHMHLICLCL